MRNQDILERYADWQRGEPAPPEVAQDFERVAGVLPAEVLGDALEDAFRAEETPAFEEMVADLYAHSDGRQRAALLDTVLRELGTDSHFSPEEAGQVNARDVQELVGYAAHEHPDLVHRLSEFYARAPSLVKTLGADALAIALTRLARMTRH